MVLPEAGCIACKACRSCTVPGSGCGLLGVSRKAIYCHRDPLRREKKERPAAGVGGKCGGGPRPGRGEHHASACQNNAWRANQLRAEGGVAPMGFRRVVVVDGFRVCGGIATKA